VNKLFDGGVIMRKRTLFLLALLLVVFPSTVALAEHHTPEDRGKAHFKNPAFAGGKKSCDTCHAGGSGLEGTGAKTAFSIMGAEQGSLEQAINVCIVKANKGNALDVNSVEMQELASYIRSLGVPKMPAGGK
jgi:cytochrome c